MFSSEAIRAIRNKAGSVMMAAEAVRNQYYQYKDRPLTPLAPSEIQVLSDLFARVTPWGVRDAEVITWNDYHRNLDGKCLRCAVLMAMDQYHLTPNQLSMTANDVKYLNGVIDQEIDGAVFEKIRKLGLRTMMNTTYVTPVYWMA